MISLNLTIELVSDSIVLIRGVASFQGLSLTVEPLHSRQTQVSSVSATYLHLIEGIRSSYSIIQIPSLCTAD